MNSLLKTATLYLSTLSPLPAGERHLLRIDLADATYNEHDAANGSANGDADISRAAQFADVTLSLEAPTGLLCHRVETEPRPETRERENIVRVLSLELENTSNAPLELDGARLSLVGLPAAPRVAGAREPRETLTPSTVFAVTTPDGLTARAASIPLPGAGSGSGGSGGSGSGGNGNAQTLNGHNAAYFLDRAHHTGTQPISTIDNLQSSLDALAAASGGNGSQPQAVQHLVFAGARPWREYGVGTSSDQWAFRLADYASEAAFRAALSTGIRSLEAFAGLQLVISGDNVWADGTGTLTLTFNAAAPALKTAGARVDEFVVENGDDGQYSANGGADFALGLGESVFTTNQRAVTGQAGVVCKGSSNDGHKPPAPTLNSAASINANLVLRLPIYETSGNILHDISGNNLAVILPGSPTFSEGRVNPHNRIGLSDSSALFSPGSGGFSLFIRLKTGASVTGDNRVVYWDYGADPTNAIVLIVQANGKLRMNLRDSAGVTIIGDDPTPLEVNTVYNLALVRNGGNVKLYKDAVVVSDQTTTLGPINTTGSDYGPSIGDQPAGTLDAAIDTVGIWLRSLSAAEISALQTNPYLGINGAFGYSLGVQSYYALTDQPSAATIVGTGASAQTLQLKGATEELVVPDASAATLNGPDSSTNNAVALWDGTEGSELKDSQLTVDIHRATLRTDDNDVNGLVTTAYGNNPGVGAQITGARAGGTAASPTVVGVNQRLATFGGKGWNSSVFRTGGSIRVIASQLWSGLQNGARLVFSTVPNGTQSEVAALTVADNGAIGVGGDFTPDASALLELQSTTQGFLPPRLTTTQRDAIASPAVGLMIFNLTTRKNETFDGAVWNAASGGGSSIFTPYTVATLPTFADAGVRMPIYVTDGASGNPCFAAWNGAAWVKVSDLSALVGGIAGKPAYPSLLDGNPINSGQVGFYLFNEGTGATAHDIAGNARNAVLHSGATWTTEDSEPLLAFDGTSNGYLSITDNDDWNISDTLSVFLKFTTGADVSNQQPLIDRWGSANPQWLIDIYGGATRFIIRDSGTNSIVRNSGAISPNTTYTFGGVYDGANGLLDIYLNAVLDNDSISGSVPGSAHNYSTGSGAPRIGAHATSTTQFFQGQMNVARLWKRALTSTEITALDANPYLGAS